MRQGKHFKYPVTDDVLLSQFGSTPKEVLEQANVFLKEHGLEFIEHKTFSSWYAFSLRKIRK